jgi:hypothetical protein
MTKHITLVQCTNAKRDGRHVAADLYDASAYFRKQRRYARVVADCWFIQSAEYGLVKPDALIHSYDTHAGDLDDPDAWAKAIAADLSNRVGRGRVELLGGTDYTDPLGPHLDARGFDVSEPLAGKGIGERMQWLDGRVEEVLNASLHG